MCTGTKSSPASFGNTPVTHGFPRGEKAGGVNGFSSRDPTGVVCTGELFWGDEAGDAISSCAGTVMGIICFCLDGSAGVIPGLGTVRVTQGGAYPARTGGATGADSARTGDEGVMGGEALAGRGVRTEEMGSNVLFAGDADSFDESAGMS